MNFKDFQEGINKVINKSGENVKVTFYNDTDNGKYIAKCNNGVTFTGNATTLQVTVKWGSGHTATASI